MKIVVCYKNVADEEAIGVAKDGTLDFSKAKPKIGTYDLNAFEAGISLAEKLGDSEVIALTAADSVLDNKQQTKAAIARGTDRMIGVRDASLEDAGSFATAAAIANQIEAMGDVDLVLFGEGSGDRYAQQVGAQVGFLLGWSTVNAVSDIQYADGSLAVKRALGTKEEELTVALPAAISVTSNINLPRVPKMKDILAAGKKPADVVDATIVADKAANEGVRAKEQTDRDQVVYDGATDEAIAAVVAALKKAM